MASKVQGRQAFLSRMQSAIPRSPGIKGDPVRALMKAGCTEKGAMWLLQALNPFPDYTPTDRAGFPDMTTQKTIVLRLSEQMAISKPGGLGLGNWDCNIFVNPNLNPSLSLQTHSIDNGGTLAWANDSGANFKIGHVNAISVLSGGITWPSSAAAFAPTSLAGGGIQSLDIGQYLEGNCRLVSHGLEVYNTTAEINIQGSVLVYRQPASLVLGQNYYVDNVNGGGFYGPYLGHHHRGPPSTLAEATLLSNSKSWKAKDGCYLVSTMNNPANPLIGFNLGIEVIDRTVFDVDNATASYAVAPKYIGQTQATSNGPPGNNPWTSTASQMKITPYDISGAYFSGLSSTTTLNVISNWYVELAPACDSKFIPFATSSTPSDPVALELYAKCICAMPAGVPVEENGFGEWFKKVLGFIGSAAPAVGNALGTFIPGASAIGNGIGSVSKFASDQINL